MSKIERTVYKCDVCGSEYSDKKNITNMPVPIKELDCEGRGFFKSMKDLDLCNNCKEKYFDAVFKHFAVVTDILGKIDSKIKYE